MKNKRIIFGAIVGILLLVLGGGLFLWANEKLEPQVIPKEQSKTIPEEPPPLCCSAGNFIRARGTTLTDGQGNPYLIKAMGFGNACWSNHESPTYGHNTEEDYARLHELGFNTVRYYLNYGLFEDDSAPYTYKQQAWDWIDQNVAWAKKHEIKIMFNMHYPQGGFQSAGNGMALWQNGHDEQKRLAALWQAIAARYAQEEAVLGYGLVNEPFMPWLGNEAATIAQWETLAQDLVEAIREVDKNHTIFVEAAFAAKDVATNQVYYQLNGQKNLIKVDDPCQNVVQEIHYYQPAEFTHMQPETAVAYLNYPNEDIAITQGEQWIASTYQEVVMPGNKGTENGWTKIETQLFSANPAEQNVFYLTLAASALQGGVAYFDDATIDLYDGNGNYVKNIVTFDFSIDDQWNRYYSADGTGSVSYVATDGHGGNGCIAISGANQFASVGKSSPIRVMVKEGYQYKLSVWVKTTGNAQDTMAFPQFALCKGNEASPYTQAYMSRMLGSYQAITNSWNVPLFLGEFGVLIETYQGHGGAQWIKDMIGACGKQNVGFSQHLYHMEGFGLYLNSQYQLPAQENVALKNALLEAVKPLK